MGCNHFCWLQEYLGILNVQFTIFWSQMDSVSPMLFSRSFCCVYYGKCSCWLSNTLSFWLANVHIGPQASYKQLKFDSSSCYFSILFLSLLCTIFWLLPHTIKVAKSWKTIGYVTQSCLCACKLYSSLVNLILLGQ